MSQSRQVKSIAKIIEEVESEAQQKRDAELKKHHAANAKLDLMFDALNDSEVRRKYDADVDKVAKGPGFEVKRGRKVVCYVGKEPDNEVGDIKVRVQLAGKPPDTVWFDDVELALKHVIRLLRSHKDNFQAVDKLDGFRSNDEENSWKTM